jgi:hypothetical protein
VPTVWPPGPHSAELLREASVARERSLGRHNKKRLGKKQLDEEGLD